MSVAILAQDNRYCVFVAADYFLFFSRMAGMQVPHDVVQGPGDHVNRAMRLMSSANKSMEKHMRIRIKAVIDTDPTILQGTSDYMKSRGKLDSSGEPIKETAKKALLRYGKRIKSQIPSMPAAPCSSPIKGLNKNFTRLNNTPNNRIEGWLSAGEPGIFTLQNFKAITIRGDRDGSNERLCEYMEHMYGIESFTPLFAAGREQSDLAMFEKALPSLNRMRGRRGRDLVIPVKDWSTCLWNNYTVEKQKTGFVVRHRWTNDIVKIPHEYLVGVTSIEQFTTFLMFSERRAFFKTPCYHGTGIVFMDLFVMNGFTAVKTSAQVDPSFFRENTQLSLSDQSAEAYEEMRQKPTTNTTYDSTIFGGSSSSSAAPVTSSTAPIVLIPDNIDAVPKRRRITNKSSDGLGKINDWAVVPPPRVAG